MVKVAPMHAIYIGIRDMGPLILNLDTNIYYILYNCVLF